jgi:esterase/lipase superfamily enzyme
LGAREPFAQSVRGKYLVAALDNDLGLALWDVLSRKLLRRLEDSDRRYDLLAISADARWIAGVRAEASDKIDIWRADSGEHARVLQAAGGPINNLEFLSGNRLRVEAADGKSVVFAVPGGSRGRGFARGHGAVAAAKPTTRGGTAADPAAPPAPSGASGRPLMADDRDTPPVPQNAPTIEAFGPPRVSAATPRSIPRETWEEAPTAGAPTAPQSTAGEPANEVVAPAAERPSAAQPSAAAADGNPLDPVGVTRAESAAPYHFETNGQPPLSVSPPANPPVAKALPSRVTVYFATNRNRLAPADRAWETYFVNFFGSVPAFAIYGLVSLAVLILPWLGKRSWAAASALGGLVLLCSMGAIEAYVRSQWRNELTGERYGCRATDLSYGVCEISVPSPQNRRVGELNRPASLWIFELPEDSSRHFVLRHVEDYADRNAFYQRLSAQLDKSASRAALVFIHGYNVSFEDAIFRTAQLTVDLKFPGAPISFCWPSFANPVKYAFDEQQAEVSIPALREVLEDLATRSGARRIHIIAHSMGNRVLAGALRNMDTAAQVRNQKVFREVVLAAPDIDCRVFKSQILPYIVRNSQHCTLYASSRDRALLMSRCFHDYQRLGEAQPELLVANGLDTIDASLVDTSLLGHSYIGDVDSIVSDLHDLVVSEKPPTERPCLEALEHNAMIYWLIRPRLETALGTSRTR